MKPTQEYKKETISILLGSIVLFLPFLNISYFVIAFLGGALFFSRISTRSPIFAMFAEESDMRSGKLIGLIQLFVTMSILLLLSLLIGTDRFPLFIIGAALAITTFGNGITSMVSIHGRIGNGTYRKQKGIKLYSAKTSVVFLISGSVYAFLSGAWIWAWTKPAFYHFDYGILFFLSVLGALTGAFLESIIIRDENLIIPLGSAMTMWLFYTFSFSYHVDTQYLVQVLIFAFALGYLAFKVRIADISAMLSATLLGVVIIISSELSWFFMLLMFFFLGGIFTRYKYNYKLSLGIAEGKGGVRGYKNVFSNSLAALCLSIAYGILPSHHGELILSAFLGSVATATGDTLASEIGETYRGEPRMITTFKKVVVGTDGAISSLGQAAAFFGASVIGVMALLFIRNDLSMVIAVIAGGFIGTNIDSLLGATLQKKGYLSNNGVNLFATISGALVSGTIYYSMGS